MCVKNDAERGWMLENIVYMALRRSAGKISYIINADGTETEVDFHVHDKISHGKWLVQVFYAMSDAVIFNRETNAIKFAREKTGIRDCTIVTWDDEGEIDGIRIVLVWKWLLT
jgi:predicted AAA+ superfamily ATPase